MLSNFEVIDFNSLMALTTDPKSYSYLYWISIYKHLQKIGWLCQQSLESIFIARKCEKNKFYVFLQYKIINAN